MNKHVQDFLGLCNACRQKKKIEELPIKEDGD